MSQPRALNPLASARVARPELVELLRTALAAGPLELVAQGPSMRPALRPGDRVRLEARLPRRGEIALVIAGRRLVLHRVLRRRGEGWLLRGDARRLSDGWIRAGDILGVATARARADGKTPEWQRLDGGLSRSYGLVIAQLAAWALRMRERLRVSRQRMRALRSFRDEGKAFLGPLQARRERGSLDGARDRTRSAAQTPRGES